MGNSTLMPKSFCRVLVFVLKIHWLIKVMHFRRRFFPRSVVSTLDDASLLDRSTWHRTPVLKGVRLVNSYENTSVGLDGALPGPVLFGISTDGILVSGITEEFLKIASVFFKYGYKIYLDLGYDVRADKGDFFRPYANEAELLPDWVSLARIDGLATVSGYKQSLVKEILELLPEGDLIEMEKHLGSDLPSRIAASIVSTWRRLGVSTVIVENGTLPENVIFTRALYLAIEQYGDERRMEPYVLWRDHDVMWFSESSRYGNPPFNGIPKPPASRYIRYATITGAAREQLVRWAPHLDVAVVPNCFHFAETKVDDSNCGFRSHYRIPRNALLIARCTRVVPQKRIDRDLYLLHALRRMIQSAAYSLPIYLFITGCIDENKDETRRLTGIARELGIEDSIVYGNGLLPCIGPRSSIHDSGRRQYSISDLLAHCDLSSFLTSYDYEGFGNPPAEACAHMRPFISSTYELYDEVYGSKGFKSLLLPTSKGSDGMPGPSYARDVLNLLFDEDRRQQWAQFNFRLGKIYFSMESLERRLRQYLPGALESRQRYPVVAGGPHSTDIESASGRFA